MNSTFDAHVLRIWNEKFECTFIRLIEELLPRNPLLPSALLEEKVLATVALKGQLAAACALQTLLGTAMRLELGHVARKGTGKSPESKG